MLFVCMAVSAQKPFEGEIQYRNFENHSKTVRKFSKGMSYNGARDVKVIVKGKNVLIKDESLHLNTLLLPDEEEAIVYSDVLKRGLKCTYSDYTRTYMSTYGPNTWAPQQTKEYSVKKTNATKNIDGHKCVQYAGKVITHTPAPEPIVTDVEVWTDTKYKMPEAYLNYLYGIVVDGLVVKCTTDLKSKVPLFGRQDSFVASEMKSVTPRKVDDSEMTVPADYELKETDSPFKMNGIHSDTKKYLKNNKMYPADADADTEVTYKIEEEWDF